MRTADIKVGEDYHFQPYKFARGMRVRVLETGVRRRTDGWDRRYQNDGVRFVTVNSDGVAGEAERTEPSRKIESTWADYEARQKAAEESRKAARRNRLDATRQKWERIALVSRVLEEAGTAPLRETLYDDEDAAYAGAAGLTVSHRTSEYGGGQIHEVTLYGVDHQGNVRLSALADAIRVGGLKVVD